MNIRFYGKSLDGSNQRIPQFMDQINNYEKVINGSRSDDRLNDSANLINVSLNDRYEINHNKFKTNRQIDVVKNRMQLIQYQENKRKNQIAYLDKQSKKQDQQQKWKEEDQMIKEQKYLENQEELKEKQNRNQQFRINQKKTQIKIKEQLQRQKKQGMFQIKKQKENDQQRVLVDKQQYFLNQQSRRRIIQDNIINSRQKIDQFWIEKAICQKQEQLKDVVNDDVIVKENVKKLMELNQQEQEMLERLKNTEHNLQMQLQQKSNNI